MDVIRGILPEAVLQSLPDTIFIVYPDGTMRLLRTKASSRTPEGKEWVLLKEGYGMNLYTDMEGNRIPYEDSPSRRALCGEMTKDRLIRVELSDKPRFVTVSSIPVFDETGQVQFAVTRCHDISGHLELQQGILREKEFQLQAEREKIRSLLKAIEQKDEFIALITHELKMPLTVINAAVQALEALCGMELSDRAAGFLKKIKQNSYRQLRLVNHLLDITRMKSGYLALRRTNRDVVYLTQSIIESIQTYAQLKNIRCVFLCSFKKKVIGVDEEKYEKILLNLLSNAIKYSPRDKTVHIRVSLQVKGKGSWLCMEVEDQGIGIPKETQKQIFNKFERAEAAFGQQTEGNGIGLYLVRLLVEALGGEISLTSAVGTGSTFKVLLPADKATDTGILTRQAMGAAKKPGQSTEVEFSDI